MTSIARPSDPLPYDPTAPLRPSGNLRRRLVVSRVAQGGAILASVIAVAALLLVTFDVITSGAPVLNLHFLTQDPAQIGSGGGIRADIIGTAIIVVLAAMVAMPVGILIAIYLTEFATPRSRAGNLLRLGLDLMQGVPSIVLGLFMLGFIVDVQHKDSGFAGSMALAVIMLPLVARSSEEVLRLVPSALRDASDALGVNRWRSILTVILPDAVGGIVTGAILAVARGAGETAPLLVLDSTFANHTSLNWFDPMPNIPVSILTAQEAQDPNAFPRAWGAALVLLFIILVANIGARTMLARSRRKIAG